MADIAQAPQPLRSLNPLARAFSPPSAIVRPPAILIADVWRRVFEGMVENSGGVCEQQSSAFVLKNVMLVSKTWRVGV
jgi:hypothetical protein